MPWPDSANTDLSRLVTAAADLCRRPLRHGVVLESGEDDLDCSLRLEVRSAEGERLESEDLDLEIYRSGDAVHLTLAWQQDDTRPMLWQGEHPLWMDPQGRRCERPQDGLPIEALARRLRALLVPLNPAVDP